MIDALNNQKTGGKQEIDIKTKGYLETLSLTTTNKKVMNLYENMVLNLDKESKNVITKDL